MKKASICESISCSACRFHQQRNIPRSSKIDLLSGVKLIKPDNTAVEAPKVLASKKLVLFYFSAHWCPPCRMFTPMLRDFYEVGKQEAKIELIHELFQEASELGVEIVFISSDRSHDNMMGYIKESHEFVVVFYFCFEISE